MLSLRLAPYARGLLVSATGVLIISPDGLLLRLVAEAGVWDVIFYRSLFTALSLTLVLPLIHRRGIVALVAALGWYGAATGALLAASNMAFVGGMMNTTVANALVMLAAMPLFSALLGRLIIGEKVAPRTWAAILVAFGGVVFIVADGVEAGSWMGDLFAMAASFSYALTLVLWRRAGDRDMTPALCVAGVLGALAALPFARPLAVSAHDLSVLALLGLVVLPLALSLYFAGTRTVPAAEVALLALLETVLGPLWAWLGVGEAPGSATLLGGAVVLAAVAANSAAALRDRRGRAAPEFR